MFLQAKLYHIVLIFCCGLINACSSFQYYSQSISGQIELFLKQKPVAKVLDENLADPVTREKLSAVEEILIIAHQQMHLPDNGSYRKYADLDRPYIVWNVFAAPELSLQSKTWCYLIVGCLNYRGYFRQHRANEYAERLREAGWDVYVGGVRAYSTLGWFRDPLTNAMMDQELWEIARIIFHELAHQRLYVENNTDFNEAFADAVAMIGLEKWLQTRPAPVREKVQATLQQEKEFIDLALTVRDKLAELYAALESAAFKRQEKILIIERFRQDYRELKAAWGNDNRYDRWVETSINNASLSAISTYRRLIPYFLAEYKKAGNDIKLFYTRVAAAAEYSPSTNTRLPDNPGIPLVCPEKQ